MSSGPIIIALRAPEGEQQDNPFAPPPEGAPEKPWQPRRPDGAPEGDDGSDRPEDGTPPPPPVWGGQWSNQQPGRQDGFGNRPTGPDTPPGGSPQPTGPRFDPTDPAQRRSRYALVCGGWGLIFAILGWTEIALLLGALALYWGISALRMKPEDRAAARAEAVAALAESGADTGPRPTPTAGPASQRSFAAAAWSGIITSGVALAIVATSFTFQFVYEDYYTCKRDALTTPAGDACRDLLPKPLRPILDTRG
ncbi:hypothetical protein QMK19_11080 [Streptomyces sp. H10-C2]|uniref:hypothetical protein n=1 Tax=unclassified Streptomyces TaxID=2593676 RepID=UPI0024BAB760|nr:MULTISPECIES: hypothetical protein [unclassified Streptomyces]MDJ0340553.1 hypothetical protein [Streptomyces sp. PH10-H1]MDJ0370201.1 hypothetical protein [Streptomyces sp. H10-C2]